MDKKNKEIEKIKDNFIETAGQLCVSVGFNRAVGQIYALLFFTEGPLSLKGIAEALSMSKGNVSINVRNLERWGAIKKVWKKGSREDYYEAELDIIKVVKNIFVSGINKRVGMISELISENEELLEKYNNKETKIYKERIRRIMETKEVIMNLLNLIKHERE
jgi:DNA-binding transcriptional regulator GbsR (MarR family)